MRVLSAALASVLIGGLAAVAESDARAAPAAGDPWAGKTALVVAQEKVRLMDGPRVVGTVNNLWVRALESQGEWVWVETTDGTKGWILASQMLREDEAEPILTRRIAADPRNPELYRLRGMVHGAAGRYDAELADINTALRLAPNEYEYYNQRGQALVAKGEEAKGLADFERGLRLQPTEEFLIYGAANTHYRLKQYADSLRHLDELVRLYPTRAYGYRSRAMVKSELGLTVEALVDYGKARRLDPEATTGVYGGLAEESIWWEEFAVEDLIDSPPEKIATFVPIDAIDWEIRAAAWVEAGLQERAIADYTMAIQKSAAPQAELYAARGWAFYEADRLDSARRDFDAALRLQPDAPRNLAERGLVRLRQGDEDGALEDWEAAAAAAPAWAVNQHLDLGWLRYRRGDRAGATRAYLTARDRWLGNGLSEVEPLFASDAGLRAQLERERASAPRADAYAATLAADVRARPLGTIPSQPAEAQDRAAAQRAEEVRLALLELAAAAAADEAFALPSFCRGGIHEERREWARAVEDFAEAVRRDPAFGAGWFRLGYCRMEGLRQFDEALADFQRAIDLGFDVPGAHLNRGWIRQQRGEHREAIADFDRALAVDPEYALALNDRGVSRELLGDRDGALADYTAALAVAPKNVRTLTNLGLLRQSAGDFRRALDDLEAAVAADPAAHDAHAALARLRATCREETIRDAEEAVMHATQACELSGWKDAEDIRTLACALAESGDFGAARRRLDEALALATDVQRAEWEPLRERFARGQPWHDGGT